MIYVFDVDGTITIVGDRLNLIKKDKKDWDAFYNKCDEDEPNIPILNLYRQLDINNHEIIALTGRRESCRQKTLEWFFDHGAFLDTTDLLMRPDGNTEKATELKPRMLRDWIMDKGYEKRHESEFLIFEDSSSMVKKWRELGYTCCQVAEGDF